MTDEQKLQYIRCAKAELAVYLRSLTWEQKVASIERMNAAGKIAREGMRQALERERREHEAASAGVSLPACDVKPLA